MRRLQVAESAEPPQPGTDEAAAPHGGNGDSSMQDADDAPTPDSAQPPRTPAPAVTPPVEPAAAAGARTGTSA